MRNRLSRLSFTFALALLAGCAGGSTTAPLSSGIDATPQSILTNPLVRLLPGERAALAAADTRTMPRKSWSAPDSAKQSVYVVDPSLAGYYGGVCYYGASGGAQLGCLYGGASSNSGIDFPEGSWINRHHHLFVANGSSSSGYSGAVTEYALPLTAASTPINTLYSNVTNMSQGALLDYVCGDRAGNIYGTTLYSTTIAVWKAGTQNGTPTSTLVDSKLQNVGSPSLADGPVACATDHDGNLYVSGQYAVGSTGNYNYFAELDEFRHGLKGSGRAKVLQRETSDLYFPAGVSIDAQGNLAWALFDLSDSGSSVCTYPKPYTGTPTACTSGFATGFHFTKSGADLWGGDTTVYPWYAQPGPHKIANEIAYPGGGLVQSTQYSNLLTPVDASVNPPLP